MASIFNLSLPSFKNITDLFFGTGKKDKRDYRAAPAIYIRPGSYTFDHAYESAFPSILHHPQFETFKKAKGLKTDKEASGFLKGYLEQGYCDGLTHEILQAVRKTPDASCRNLLRSIEPEKIFYTQMLSTMSVFIAMKRAGVKEELEAFEEYDLAKKLLDREISPWQVVKSEFFLASADLKTYRTAMEILVKPGESSCGQVLITSSKILDRGIGAKVVLAHAIFFQTLPNKFRFYDPIDAREGFYELPDKESFLEILKQQAIDDMDGDPEAEVQLRLFI